MTSPSLLLTRSTRCPSFLLSAVLPLALWLAVGCSSSGGGGTPPGSSGSGGAASGGTTGSGGASGGSTGSGGGSSGGATGSGGATASDGAATGGADGGGNDGPAGNDVAGSDGPPGVGALAAWQYFKPLTLDTTASGANVAGDVAKYPIAVLLNAANFDFTQAKDQGADLRFSAPDGTLLPHAVELWDRTAKLAAVWVKVDVAGNRKTPAMIINWGNPAATDTGNSAAVFDTKDGFIGVWHLGQPSSVTAGGYKDATANAADATGINTQTGASGDGRIGKAVSLTASQRQWIRLDGGKNALFDRFETVTYSIWTYARTYPGEYVTPFAKGDNSWRIHMYGSASWGENKNKHIVEMCAETTANEDECAINQADPSTGTDVAPARWFHWIGVLDHPKMTLYLNGVQEITVNSGANWKSDAQYPVGMGNNSQIPSRFWDGLLDEARVMSVAKDASWAKLEYESQREGQTFLTFGETQKRF